MVGPGTDLYNAPFFIKGLLWFFDLIVPEGEQVKSKRQVAYRIPRRPTARHRPRIVKRYVAYERDSTDPFGVPDGDEIW